MLVTFLIFPQFSTALRSLIASKFACLNLSTNDLNFIKIISSNIFIMTRYFLSDFCVFCVVVRCFTKWLGTIVSIALIFLINSSYTVFLTTSCLRLLVALLVLIGYIFKILAGCKACKFIVVLRNWICFKDKTINHKTRKTLINTFILRLLS